MINYIRKFCIVKLSNFLYKTYVFNSKCLNQNKKVKYTYLVFFTC